MGRQRRDFKRAGSHRDSTLFVIASEGAETEPRYFEAIRENHDNSRMHIHVLRRNDPTRSAPLHVIAELDRFRDEFSLQDRDQLWLVIDRDSQSWSIEMISRIAQECHSKGYFLAASNPCFELWLPLHFEDVAVQDETRKQRLAENARGFLKAEVARHRQPDRSDGENLLQRTALAIARAEALDVNPQERWPSVL